MPEFCAAKSSPVAQLPSETMTRSELNRFTGVLPTPCRCDGKSAAKIFPPSQNQRHQPHPKPMAASKQTGRRIHSFVPQCCGTASLSADDRCGAAPTNGLRGCERWAKDPEFLSVDTLWLPKNVRWCPSTNAFISFQAVEGRLPESACSVSTAASRTRRCSAQLFSHSSNPAGGTGV